MFDRDLTARHDVRTMQVFIIVFRCFWCVAHVVAARASLPYIVKVNLTDTRGGFNVKGRILTRIGLRQFTY